MMLGGSLKYFSLVFFLINTNHGNTANNSLNSDVKLAEYSTKSIEPDPAIPLNNFSEKLIHSPRENVPTESTLLTNFSIEIDNPKKNDGTNSVAKKGVEQAIVTKTSESPINITSDITTTPYQLYEKNVITEHLNDHNSDQEHSKTYVVLVIAIVFTIPLLAFLCISLYKKGSEWWEHRHYRRMDFLIEGMYNN